MGGAKILCGIHAERRCRLKHVYITAKHAKNTCWAWSVRRLRESRCPHPSWAASGAPGPASGPEPPDLALEGRGRHRETSMWRCKCKCFGDGLKPVSFPRKLTQGDFLSHRHAARTHMHFPFLGENVSFVFLPVYVRMPTTKCLKNRNELLPRNGGQSSKIWSIKLLIYSQINLQPVKFHIFSLRAHLHY